MMHARELIELAALVSSHSGAVIEGTREIPKASVDRYWVASKSRLDRWGEALKRISIAGDDTGRGQSRHGRQAPPVRGVLEEILTGEVLTRVWTAAMCAYDRYHGTGQIEPVVRSVMVGHLEARHRVLTLLVQGPGIDAALAIKLNRLRRRAERWTDVLIGYLAAEPEIGEFAVDPERARDFAEDLHRQVAEPGGRQAWPLMLASLRVAFRQGLAPRSPNADLNAAIAESILSCFSAELFHSTGLLRSAWLVRLSAAANDAEGMIDDLLDLDQVPTRGQVPDSTPDSISGRLSNRPRRFGQ